MKLVVGCGYLGSRVARLWQARGEDVAAVTRRADRAGKFERSGYLPVVADVTNAASLDRIRELTGVDSVLYAVSYDRASGKTRQEVFVDGVANLLAALPSSVRRFIYISTTGVYGQTDGSWVVEDSPCEPSYEGGRVALKAESVIRDHPIAERTIILRMAGLYGPGRIPRRDELIAAKPLNVSPDSYVNLIHVDDAAQIVAAVDAQARPPQTYLVSDGRPVVRREYYAELARLLGTGLPQFRPTQERNAGASRGNTNKRLNNARLTAEIGYQLQYPSYKQGLAASIGST